MSHLGHRRLEHPFLLRISVVTKVVNPEQLCKRPTAEIANFESCIGLVFNLLSVKSI